MICVAFVKLLFFSFFPGKPHTNNFDSTEKNHSQHRDGESDGGGAKTNKKRSCEGDKKYKYCCPQRSNANANLNKLATDVLVEHLKQSEHETNPTFNGASKLQSMIDRALDQLNPHEKQPGHPAWMLHQLLSKAPVTAEIWDVLGHSFNAARAVGIPPAASTLPGKVFILRLYNVFCESKTKEEELDENEEKVELTVKQVKQEERQENFNQWKNMSDLLSNAILLMFEKARTLGNTSSSSST